MSGTSLDGLDICYSHFSYAENIWKYNILKATTIKYPSLIKHKLSLAQSMTAEEFSRFHFEYGCYLGEEIHSFINTYGCSPMIVCSHGHTIFHQPQDGFTCQIGSGACIAAKCEIDTICDFRSTDVALGGQGAPLVPVGDSYLFTKYDYCLNLGGFSNISKGSLEEKQAYDIVPVNYVLNHYAKLNGSEFDLNGNMANSGTVNKDLLQALNEIPFYEKIGPKSLGREWVEENIFPLIDSFGLSIPDKLATFCEHIAEQIEKNIEKGSVLVTGGGVYNCYLMDRIRTLAPHAEFHIPCDLTVKFKEALIFGFLGVLFLNNQCNVLSSVTGSKCNHVGGAFYKGINC